MHYVSRLLLVGDTVLEGENGVLFFLTYDRPRKVCRFPSKRSTFVETFLHPVFEKTGKLSVKNAKSSRTALTSAPLTEAPEADSSRTMH